MRYRPEIDGLRAVAVLPVMLFHAGFGFFAGGYVGVDVFFVISGYLITRLVVEEVEAGTFSLVRFYERRARRILPALFVVLACCLPFAWMWMLPSQFRDFSEALAFVAAFSSNLLFATTTGYFAIAAEENVLLHTWSLAVEEQFYILFPMLLLFLRRRRRLTLAISVLCVLSLALAEWGWRTLPDHNFYLLPTRAWELGVGSLCALVTTGRRGSTALSGLGLALILLAVIGYDHRTPMPSLYALVPVGGAALVILHATPATAVGRMLAMRPVVGLGLASYSAYLWHQPLFAFARIRSPVHPGPEMMGLLVIAALALAWLSWRLVELPFRRRHSPVLPSAAAVCGAAGGAAGVLLCAGLIGCFADGLPQRWPAWVAVMETQAQQSRRDAERCNFRGRALPRHPVKECTAGTGPARFAIIGDSHAGALFRRLAQDIRDDGISLYHVSYFGCPPIPGLRRADRPQDGACSRFNEELFGFLLDGGFAGVVVATRWALYLEERRFDNTEGGVEAGGAVELAPADGPGISDAPRRRAWVAQAYRSFIAGLAGRLPVILVYPIPEAGWRVPQQAVRLALTAGSDELPEISTARDVFAERNAGTVQALDQVSGNAVWRIRPDEHLCRKQDGRCLNSTPSGVLYHDDDHLTALGASLVTPGIRAAMLEIVARRRPGEERARRAAGAPSPALP